MAALCGGSVGGDDDPGAGALHGEGGAGQAPGEPCRQVHQSGVSRHLRILHEAGFVSVRPDGQRRYYALEPERFRELDTWLTRYRSLWETRLDRFGAALERNRKTKERSR